MKISVITATLLLATTAIHADDDVVTIAGKLHTQNCVSCHKPDIYTKAERRVASRAGLTSQVRLCVQQLELPWFDEEIEIVADYLNKEYYHFE